MKTCRKCKKLNVYERNGLPVSKWCVACRKERETERKTKKCATKGFQDKLRKRLHKKAWRLIGEYVRRKGAGSSGLVECYTCGILKHYKELQCGHFFHNRLDFDERNLKPQCPQCNTYKSGNLAIYALKLIKEIGQEELDKLHQEANTKGNNYSIQELEYIIVDLERRLQKLKDSE